MQMGHMFRNLGLKKINGYMIINKLYYKLFGRLKKKIFTSY